MSFFLSLIERVAYAVTRGAIKAIWEELRKPRTAVDEELTDEDREIDSRLRCRLADWLQANSDNQPRPDSTPSDSREGAHKGLGKEAGTGEAGGRA